MLQYLRVKNLAIVEAVEVEFNSGLNVVTGETGAGKSIIVGALSLLLGERADKTMIRAGEDKCSVEAEFNMADPEEVDAILEELGLDQCEDGRLIIRRIISTSGAGKNFINDCSVTLQALGRIGDLLIDMHGPHDHQSLLNQDFQLDILDSFAHTWKQRAQYEDCYRELLALKDKRSKLDGDDQNVEQQIDMLSFQIKEIEDAAFEDDEEESLEQEHSVSSNSQRIIEIANFVTNALTEDDSSAFSTMVQARVKLGELTGIMPESEEWLEEIRSINIQIQELSKTVSGRAQEIESDPERLQWLDDRMTLLHKLKRKYGATVPEINTFLEKARGDLDDLSTRGEKIKELDNEIEKVNTQLVKLGSSLAGKRASAATALSNAITKELHDLGFAHGAFKVMLTCGEPRPTGLDVIDFGFAPNVGEPMRPLRSIASSGEISRVMLATKAVLADHDKIPLLVFDEIDSNVGGEMGSAIGEKLAKVAATHQVLCITHLPQVAANGTTHFIVAKQVTDSRTKTAITRADGNARAEEIARMLGGKDLTSVTLTHAKELLNNSSVTA